MASGITGAVQSGLPLGLLIVKSENLGVGMFSKKATGTLAGQKIADNPFAPALQSLWSAKWVTLSLGAFRDQIVVGPRDGQPESHWMGFLHSEFASPLLPASVYILPPDRFPDRTAGMSPTEQAHEQGRRLLNAYVTLEETTEQSNYWRNPEQLAEPFDFGEGPGWGELGSGFVQVNTDNGSLLYVVVLRDSVGDISRGLERGFTIAAASNLRWLKLSLRKAEMTKEDWLNPLDQFRHTARHAIHGAEIAIRGKLPNSPTELFTWMESEEAPGQGSTRP
jgi:hypothetical protein